MLLMIDSSSLPWTHSASKRLGPTGPFAVVVPWQVAQISVNFAAIGFPRPPPRAGGAPAGMPGGAAAGGVAGGCCADAARSAAVPRIAADSGGIDFINALLLLRRGPSVRCAAPAEVEDGAGREGILARH